MSSVCFWRHPESARRQLVEPYDAALLRVDSSNMKKWNHSVVTREMPDIEISHRDRSWPRDPSIIQSRRWVVRPGQTWVMTTLERKPQGEHWATRKHVTCLVHAQRVMIMTHDHLLEVVEERGRSAELFNGNTYGQYPQCGGSGSSNTSRSDVGFRLSPSWPCWTSGSCKFLVGKEHIWIFEYWSWSCSGSSCPNVLALFSRSGEIALFIL